MMRARLGSASADRLAFVNRALCAALLSVATAACRPIGGLPADLTSLNAPPVVDMAEVEQRLKDTSWHLSIPAPSANSSEPFRWRHTALEAWATPDRDYRRELHAALGSNDALVRANAAILLARRGDDHGATELLNTARDSLRPIAQRRAAVEALAHLDGQVVRAALDELWTAVADAQARATYAAELHQELLRTLATHRREDADARLLDAWKSASIDVRLEGMAAWADMNPASPVRGGTPTLDDETPASLNADLAAHSSEAAESNQVAFVVSDEADMPEQLLDLRTDPDWRIRSSVLRLASERRHPRAIDFARSALADYDLNVRLAAIAALGAFGGDAAQSELDKILEGSSEIARSAAVDAMAAMDNASAKQTLAAAGDASWRVRRSVAQALAHCQPNEAATVARGLLSDPSVEVRAAVVASLETWPLESAGPPLLASIESGAYLPSKLATEQLRRRWPSAAELSMDMPADRRRETIDNIKRAWSHEFGAKLVSDDAAHAAQIAATAEVSDADVERVSAIVRQLWIVDAAPAERKSAIDELVSMGARLAPALERVAFDRREPLPEVIYREVLPATDVEFALLDDLLSADVSERRRAADRLARHASETPLARLAVERLPLVIEAERDALVWRGVFMAVRSDVSEAASRLAYAAASHQTPEVRRMAVEYLGRHPHARHARILDTLLADENPTVASAAIRAMAAQATLPNPGSLERLLAIGDKRLRVEVATTLARHDIESGKAALERLARDADAEVRRQAATAMGELADPAYTATLIGMLDDSLGVRTAVLTSLEQIAGDAGPRASEPAGASMADRAAEWRDWFARQGTTSR